MIYPRFTTWALGLLMALAVAACGGAPSATYQSTATVEELMQIMIDPSADAVWDAVVTEATADGIIEIRPETQADWNRLRHLSLIHI